jgi:hypothetical protein
MAVKMKMKVTPSEDPKKEKLPSAGKVRRSGLPGYHARGSAQNRIKRENKMDKLSNVYGKTGSPEREAYNKETNSEYKPRSKKEARVYDRLKGKQKRKLVRRGNRANKKSDS